MRGAGLPEAEYAAIRSAGALARHRWQAKLRLAAPGQTEAADPSDHDVRSDDGAPADACELVADHRHAESWKRVFRSRLRGAFRSAWIRSRRYAGLSRWCAVPRQDVRSFSGRRAWALQNRAYRREDPSDRGVRSDRPGSHFRGA